MNLLVAHRIPSTATHTTTLDPSSYAGNPYSLALNDTQNKLYTGGLGITWSN